MMPIDATRRLWWAVFGVYAAAVLTVSVIPVPPQIEPKIPQLDKVEHFVLYLLFSGLLLRAQLSSGWPLKRSMRLAVLGAVAYGGVCELLQAFIPYRSAEWLDEIANSVGGFVGARLMSVYAKRILHG